MISFIIPYPIHEDREVQFKLNLESLGKQKDKDFEIVTISTTDTNPASTQNECVRMSKGNILVLTSPEVINAETNVGLMKQLPEGRFWIGRVVEEYAGRIPVNLSNPTLLAIEGLESRPDRIIARCTERDWAPWKYFIGVIHKATYWDVGGMDEEYTNGIAWEDRDFADRLEFFGVKSMFNPDIAGLHLYHNRRYQDDGEELRKRNRGIYNRKRKDRELHFSRYGTAKVATGPRFNQRDS